MRWAWAAGAAMAVLLGTLAPAPAQNASEGASSGEKQPPAQLAPPKPYDPVPVKPPVPSDDPSFAAFRKQLADVAQRKDKAALQKLVVSQGFFWESDSGDKANKKRSSFDNFAAAISLNDEQGSGWEVLASAAGDPTLEPDENHKGVSCGPASPQLDEGAFEALIKATGTDAEEWGYPQTAGLEVRAAAQPNAPVIETLGLNLVRVLPEEPVGPSPPAMIRVVGPSGKVGYVPLAALSPVVFDQICYVKDGGSWKIAGYSGGD